MIVVIGRIIGVMATFYFFRMFFKKETISFPELCFITWGGMIRGAIAFALVMKIPYIGGERCKNPEYCYTKEQYDLAVSTCLMLVFITTLVFGTFMKLYQTWILGSGPEVADHHSQSERSHYQSINHPNLEKEADDPACVPSNDPDAPKGFIEYPIVTWFKT